MTVKELIETLQCQAPDSEVCIAQPMHDYCRRVEASKICKINYRDVYKDPYNLNPDHILDRDYEPKDDDTDVRSVLILE